MEEEKKKPRPRKKRRVLFDEETNLFKQEKELLKSEDLPAQELRDLAERLLNAYKDLLDQSKLSTKVNDKLMFGLNENYAELMEEKKELEDKIKNHNQTFLGNFSKIDF